jgi:hypothetical protein
MDGPVPALAHVHPRSHSVRFLAAASPPGSFPLPALKGESVQISRMVSGQRNDTTIGLLAGASTRRPCEVTGSGGRLGKPWPGTLIPFSTIGMPDKRTWYTVQSRRNMWRCGIQHPPISICCCALVCMTGRGNRDTPVTPRVQDPLRPHNQRIRHVAHVVRGRISFHGLGEPSSTGSPLYCVTCSLRISTPRPPR